MSEFIDILGGTRWVQRLTQRFRRETGAAFALVWAYQSSLMRIGRLEILRERMESIHTHRLLKQYGSLTKDEAVYSVFYDTLRFVSLTRGMLCMVA